MFEDVRRLWSTFAPRRGRTYIFIFVVFKKINSLARLMSARGLRRACKRGQEYLFTKNKQHQSACLIHLNLLVVSFIYQLQINKRIENSIKHDASKANNEGKKAHNKKVIR